MESSTSAVGSVSVITMEESLSAVMSAPNSPSRRLYMPAFSLTLSNEPTTSDAVTVLPSWYMRSSRRLNLQVRPSSLMSQSFTSIGAGLKESSNWNRPSIVCRATCAVTMSVVH